MKIQITD